MVNVSANFHTLAIQDAPTTRVRIYFIGPTVDCTDDNDVTTNGTLLVWAAGDTDSNRRIGQDGIKFTEYYNPEYNVEIGHAVSSQIEMTLVNTDGGLNNFTYGRCKVYLDVYDSANSVWLSCPMGVYIIELPTQRRSKLIHAFGYDQMQKLDVICDSWWSGLNWSGGLTLLQIVNSMASQVGVSVSTGTASAIVNSSVTYTDAPFDCVEATYRDVLEYISEATGTIARFDRDGALDMRWFSAPTIGGILVNIPTETSPNCCLGIDIAEYSVAPIDKLNVRMADGAVSVNVGSGTNIYTILDNPFLNGDSATITARATPIYNRLSALTNYSPLQAKMIWDWSLEAGDIVIFIANLGYNYVTPLFQQTMTWRGGYVIADVVNSGDPVRPVKDSASRDYYRMDANMRTMTIDADRINLLGYTTINNGFKVNLDGTFEANGGKLNGNLISDGQTGRVSITNGVLDASDLNGNVFASMEYDDLNDEGTIQAFSQNGYTNIRGNRIDLLYNGTPTISLGGDTGIAAFQGVGVSGNLTASTINTFLKIESTTIANGESGSINMPNSSSAFLLVSGIRDASKFIASVRANSAGDVSHVEFGTPGATFSVSTNTLTIANSSNGEMQILIFRF